MNKLHLEIHMSIDVSDEYLKEFNLGDCLLPNYYNFQKGSATKPKQFPDEHKGNVDLAEQIVNKCFRNNSRQVFHAKAIIMDGVV
tara:strand:+ start:181 stop:435 length:255 start_codon:yes stop_codon:yes gene_type:complete